MVPVVGNRAYEKAPFLSDPRNGAKGGGAALGRLGFKVSHLANAGKAKPGRNLHGFARASSAPVFYAGHGIENSR